MKKNCYDNLLAFITSITQYWFKKIYYADYEIIEAKMKNYKYYKKNFTRDMQALMSL